MKEKRLSFEQAKNLRCCIPLSVINDDRNYEGLRILLEKKGIIPKGKKEVMYDRTQILSVMKFEVAEAYWLSPTGMLRPVDTLHIEDIVNEPAEFGFTKKIIKETYKKHGETLPLEGKARDELVNILLGKGWTRIRYYKTGNYYDIEIGTGQDSKEHLLQWALKTLEALPERKDSRVVIRIVLKAGYSEHKLEDLISGNVLLCKKEQQRPISTFLIPLKRTESFLNMAPVARMKKKLTGKKICIGSGKGCT